jgi:hypothetical protein
MAFHAFSLSFEIHLSSSGVSNKQLLDRVLGRDSLRNRGSDPRLGVKEFRDCPYLVIGQRERGHSLFRAAVANDRREKISIHVVAHKRRPNEVRTACAAPVQSMTKAASLLEYLLTRGYTLGRILGPQRAVATYKQQQPD